ncbi:MAG: DUF1902 domain-containing protein [Oscillospiraceae bacterium]|nr:DUF1902 domain-containing protein [Oscillospiraceae bacterium]
MMYPYITLADETLITHSHLLDDGEKKSVEVHFERPKHQGFDMARCSLPSYEWIIRDGFTDEEIERFERICRDGAHIFYKYAACGGASIAAMKKDESEYSINIRWNPEARVWGAINDDIPIALESGSLDALIERVRFAVPELLELNGKKHEQISLHFFAQRYEEIQIGKTFLEEIEGLHGIVRSDIDEKAELAEARDEKYGNRMSGHDNATQGENEMQINLWSAENTVSIIIKDETSPVTYSNQTNGLACDHPKAKGYLVPVEFRGRILVKFISTFGAGYGWEPNESFYDDVPQIMKQLNDYFCDYVFELDESKMSENTESWVHLIGRRNKPESNHRGILQGFPDTFNAILTWPNSD